MTNFNGIRKNFLDKTIFSVSKEYYLKNLFVALWIFAYIFAVLLLVMFFGTRDYAKFSFILIYTSICTLLYPYTSLLTNPIINFICYKIFPPLKDMVDDAMEANAFAISGRSYPINRNSSLGIGIIKFVLRGMVLSGSPFIAPIVLMYLYIKNSRK
ncbi:hypothetical protein J3U16_11640 [Gilliamella sp. B3023]|uniref:hypothetical protein n=1 Tax=unclassified Gilliamella TaxID=2685620 RepID=UPI0022699B03|nr:MULTISPECIES: hypothetical protein [unclassified Gilliamella]MCX8585164.1 hypothetical protein [Gilliamella sp. B3562]MCX8675940.1 hypothetical protein [Gilliamella sp. B3023]MCX8685170.1 hypothetical protein [Gilliamella sp. B2864]